MDVPGTNIHQMIHAAWTRWERHPGDRSRVIDFEDAVRLAAREVGVTTCQFRIELNAARSKGLNRDDCIRRAVEFCRKTNANNDEEVA